MLDYVLKILLIASSISVHSFQGIFTSVGFTVSLLTLVAFKGQQLWIRVFYIHVFPSDGGRIGLVGFTAKSFKLVVSFVLFHFQLLRGTAKRYSYSLRDIFLWSIPALLYMIANNLYFVVISISDSPITQQVFGSLEIVVVGLANVVVLKKEFVCFVQLRIGSRPCNGPRSSSSRAASHRFKSPSRERSSSPFPSFPHF